MGLDEFLIICYTEGMDRMTRKATGWTLGAIAILGPISDGKIGAGQVRADKIAAVMAAQKEAMGVIWAQS